MLVSLDQVPRIQRKILITSNLCSFKSTLYRHVQSILTTPSLFLHSWVKPIIVTLGYLLLPTYHFTDHLWKPQWQVSFKGAQSVLFQKHRLTATGSLTTGTMTYFPLSLFKLHCSQISTVPLLWLELQRPITEGQWTLNHNTGCPITHNVSHPIMALRESDWLPSPTGGQR